jgi:hypothetical protein
MGQDGALEAETRRRIEEELVPLSVAATVTYFHVTALARQLDDEDNLAEVLHLVAVALSQVAPIHSIGPAGESRLLNAQELEKLLFGPVRDSDDLPDLDRFSIRRRDLHAAMVSLRAARSSFGRP